MPARPPADRQKHAFGQELPDQARPAGAHRKTDGDFPPSLAAASQQQTGQVRAQQREHQRPQHHVECVDEGRAARASYTSACRPASVAPRGPCDPDRAGSGFPVEIAGGGVQSGFRRGKASRRAQAETRRERSRGRGAWSGSPLSSGANEPAHVTGTNRSAGLTGQMPRKSFGPMPTMVAIEPFSRSVRPTACGSAPRCCAPEAVADHHHGSHAGLLRFRREEAARRPASHPGW